MGVRTVGVEEEMLLIDPATGMLRGVSAGILRSSAQAAGRPAAGRSAADRTEVQHELFLEQIELATPPCQTIGELEIALRRGRRLLGEAAREAGVAPVAVATPVLPPPSQTVTRTSSTTTARSPGSHWSVPCTSTSRSTARKRPWE
jgi:carboxylate-amine ligase